MNKKIYICLPLLGAALAGCESDANMPEPASNPAVLKIKAPTLTSEDSGNSELPSQLDIYEFEGEQFYRSQSVSTDEESVDITIKGDTKVFAVAGVTISGVTQSTTLEEFMAKTIDSPNGANSAPMFYAGVSELTNGDESMTLELQRGVARIDVACQDSRIVIKEIIVDNAPAQSFIVPCEAPLQEVETVTYKYSVGDDFDGTIEQAFTIFESANPVTVRVKGTFDGDLMNIVREIPSISRNKVYTLGVTGGSHLDSSISIADWQDGDNVEGLLALGENAINLEQSVIPEGVKINTADNAISFPHTGVKDMKLVFVTKAPVKLGSILGENPALTIAALEPEKTEDGYSSSFLINVTPQPKCAEGYDVTLVFNSTTNFFLNMDVEASPYQIPTVKIAGHEWMCFNATSNDVDNQLYLPDGMTVDEMYNEHFVDCLGMYFQYGKENPFSPWTSNDPAQFADQTRDIPWKTVGRMPMPKGYHVPSLNEWKDLIPNNTTIPASYMTPSGDSIKATVVTLPGTLITPSEATNARNFKMRYVLFESVFTGAKLYLPIMGVKANNKDEVPGMKGYNYDVRTSYWAAEERYIWLIDYKILEGDVEGALLQQNRWNADGFLPVRGIKD
ncbi:MAG: hypothetical protein HDR88_14065 [Bacteroides sp.]|nr:hypothetical protein [Bacteroides sp.]